MIQSNQGFSSMVLRLQTGVNDAGAPLYKDKSYPRVLPTVTPDDIYAVGGALASLSNWTLHHIQRLDRADLTTTDTTEAGGTTSATGTTSTTGGK